MSSDELVTVGAIATEQGIAPRCITDLFYSRALDTERCPVIAGRRMIPRDYIPGILIELRRAGKIARLRKAEAVVTHA